MADFTQEQYAAAIPKCCSQRTFQAHLDMLLCWGLAASIRAGRKMNCDNCDLKMPGVPSESEEAKHGDNG